MALAEDISKNVHEVWAQNRKFIVALGFEIKK